MGKNVDQWVPPRIPMPNPTESYVGVELKYDRKISPTDRIVRLYCGRDVYVSNTEFDTLYSNKKMFNDLKQLWNQREVNIFLADSLSNDIKPSIIYSNQEITSTNDIDDTILSNDIKASVIEDNGVFSIDELFSSYYNEEYIVKKNSDQPNNEVKVKDDIDVQDKNKVSEIEDILNLF